MKFVNDLENNSTRKLYSRILLQKQVQKPGQLS